MFTHFTHLDHIGIVVQDIDTSLQTYRDQLGFTLLQRVLIPEQQVEAAFLDAGNSTIELIAPTTETSGVAKFLQNRGEGLHHVCYVVVDLQAALAALKSQGLRLIDENPRRGVHGLVAFIHPKATHGALIELLQKELNTDRHR
jgi:methylmalonyl-CoA/ethylmalonyl-CoA epimerase